MKDHECLFPVMEMYKDKIKNNAKVVYELCKKNGIEPIGVVKGYSAIPELSKAFLDGGFKTLGDSRMNEIIKLRLGGIHNDLMLVRIPMMSEIPELVRYADSSLNSEIATIKMINEEAQRQKKIHGVVLMVDLGDLREGYVEHTEVIEVAKEIENNLKNVELLGIGTNLGCYGSIKPSVKNLNELCDLAERIEGTIKRKLKIISGGATSSLPLLLEEKMPKRINHLRLGEGIIVAKDLSELWNVHIPGLFTDTILLKAQIVEIKDKPSYPIGEIFVDAFGNTPEYIDRGIRKRAILAIGSKDLGDVSKIRPIEEGIEVIGSSSDHLIIDIQECKRTLNVGDIVEFDVLYASMLFLSSSDSVRKEVI